MAEAYELEFGILARSPEFPTQSVTTVTEYLPASGRSVTKLGWSYTRDGGCAELSCSIRRPYDRRGGIDHDRDVLLRIGGDKWWRGYITAVAPKLGEVESIDVTAAGYIYRADEPTFTWSFGRQSLKVVGVGEIAGVVRAIVGLMPVLSGSATYDADGNRTDAHPMCDGVPQIDFASYRPEALVFDRQTPLEIFKSLAEMAGNFEFGVDERREFYFRRAQALTAGTALYGSALWSADGSGGNYGDETYQEPQAEPPYLDIQPTAVFVIGGDVQTYDAEEEFRPVKNVLIAFGVPPRADARPPVVTVSDQAGIERWKRRLVARVSAPGLTATSDLVQWATQRLRMMSRVQLTGGVKSISHEASTHADLLIRPTGAVRVVGGASEIIERIQEVKYELKEGTLSVAVSLGYSIPPDRRLAEQLRRDATVAQNIATEDVSAFFLQERHVWPTDSWTAVLS